MTGGSVDNTAPTAESGEPGGVEDENDNVLDLKSVDMENMLSAAPPELLHKCKAILAYLIKAEVRVQRDSHRMVYEGGMIGSPLPNLLQWTVSSDRGEERPWDQIRFFRLLTDLDVAKSLYGQGKYKLANIASRPVPVAIVKRKRRQDKSSKTDDSPAEKRWKHLF